MGELTASLSAQEFARWVALSVLDKERQDQAHAATPAAKDQAEALGMFQLDQGKDTTR